jgi:virulence factor Mce-like protein
VNRRRGATAIASNPVLVGVATTLVIVVAVFLSYNANSGLPGIPTYRVQAKVPSAANLVKGNDVRIGGLRVGVIDKITPEQQANGESIAVLDMKLETTVKPLPADSTLIIRPRSALGLKYVELTKGESAKAFPEGGTIPLANATPLPVEIDEFYNMFDQRTRAGIRGNQQGFGNGFAGRGQDINAAVKELVPLAKVATKVLSNVAAPATRFDRFFASQARAARIVAPVAEIQAQLFANLDTTFIAWASVARPYLQETISKGPGGLQTAIDTFPKIRPLFLNTQLLFETLQPGAAALNDSMPALANGTTIGVKALAGAPNLNRLLGEFFTTLQAFAEDPFVPIGFRDLLSTVTILDPTIATLTPAQTTCNYINLWFRNVAGILSEGDSRGNWARFAVLVGPDNNPPNSIWGPAAAPAAGGGNPAQTQGIDANFLHNNPYPNTASPGQNPKECEAGKEPYAANQTVIGNPPGNQGTKTETPAKTKTSK